MKYTIDTSRVNDEAQRMNAIASQIMSASDTLNGIMASDGLRTDSGKRIMKSLMSVKKELEQNSRKTGKYANTLSDIAKLYEKAENKAMGEAKAKTKSKKNKGNNNFLKEGIDIAVDLVGGIAPVGSIAGIGRDFCFHESSDSFIEDIAAIPKDAYDITKAFVKNHTAKAIWTDLLDLNPEKGSDQFKSIKEQALGDYFGPEEFTTIKGVKISDQGVNCCSVLLSAAVSNLIEHHGVNVRMIDETRTEFGLSLGKQILVTAAVAGAFTLFNCTPQGIIFNLVVAAGGIVFDKVGNHIAQKVTGDPDAEWAECVSDKVCDLMEYARGKALETAVNIKGSSVQWTAALA